MHLPALPQDPLAPLSPITNLSLSNSAPHRILIVGGAYAGITAVLNLLDLQEGKQERPAAFPLPKFGGAKSNRGIKITVVDERDGFFHSVGAPLAHVAPEHTPKMWKRYTHLNELQHPDLTFIQGSVTKINAENCEAEYVDSITGKKEKSSYDYMILASGLRRHWPAVPKQASYEDYLKDGLEIIEKITGGEDVEKNGERRVVIIGAGAVGIEFAAEIKHNHPQLRTTLIHSRAKVLSSEPLLDLVKDRAKLILEEEGVEVILENRATIYPATNGKSLVKLADGTKILADAVLDTTKKGDSSARGILPAEFLDKNGELRTTRSLAFPAETPNVERHFAAGDVVAFDGIKRAGGAMVMGQIAANNLWVELLKEEREESGQMEEDKEIPQLAVIPDYPVVIGLAVGKQCLTYDGTAERWGEQLMKDYFQDDLGWQGSLKYLGLTDKVERTGEKEVNVAVAEVISDIDKSVVAEGVPVAAA